MRKTLVPMVALLAVFALGFAVNAWHANKTHQARQLAALVEVCAASLDSYFRKLDATLRFASEEILSHDAAPGAALRILDGVRDVYPELHSVSLVSPAEHGANAGTGELRRAAFPAPAAYSPDESGLALERPVWLPAKQAWVIPLRYVMRDAQGGVLRAIDGALPLSTAYQLWRDAPLPQDGRLGVLRDDGHLFTLYPLPERVRLETLYGVVRTRSPLYAHMRDNHFPQRGVVEGAGSMDGKPRLWVYRRLEHYPLTVYTSLPGSFLWRTWWEQVKHSFLLLAFGILGGVLVYQWIVRRQLAWEIAHEKAERRIRRLNRTLAQRVSQLEAANRELEAFSYTVSHDLRGPLRVIHGFSERLAALSGSRLDDKSRHCLERIKVGAQRMGDLVDGLLQLARVTQVKMEQQPIDLSHEALSIARELQQLCPERDVRFAVQDGLTARGSRALLRNLLRNLMENAWKFTAGKPDAAVSLTSEQRDGERVFVVRDNGIGFDMRYASKLFSVFQRLHGADYEGVGIGLATAARIVAKHGGRIWAEAAKGEGAAFYFVLEPRA